MDYNPWGSNNFRRWIQELLCNFQGNSSSYANSVSNTSVAQPNRENDIFHHLSAPWTPHHNAANFPDLIRQQSPYAGSSSVVASSAVLSTPPSANHHVPSVDVSDNSTAKLPPLCKLIAWCPCDMLADGNCRLAGFATSKSSGGLQFLRSCSISDVTDEGRLIRTLDHQLYELNGGISWWIYQSLHVQLKVPSLPQILLVPFCRGFPSQNWKSWVQSLYYFLSPSGSMSWSPSFPLGANNPKLHTPPPISKLTNSASQSHSNPYSHILSNYQPSVQLERCHTRSPGPSPPEQVHSPATDESFENLPSPTGSELSGETQDPREIIDLDSTSSSDRSEGWSRPASKKRGRKPKKPRRISPSKLKHGLSPKSLFKVPKALPARRPGDWNKPSTSKSGRGNLRIYTGDGRKIDTSCLEQTRSGRWVIPRSILRR